MYFSEISTHATTKANAYKSIQPFKQSLSPDGKRKKIISKFIPGVHSYVAAAHAKSTAYLFKRCQLNLINAVGDVAIKDLSIRGVRAKFEGFKRHSIRSA
jgi:hypothetical protein